MCQKEKIVSSLSRNLVLKTSFFINLEIHFISKPYPTMLKNRILFLFLIFFLSFQLSAQTLGTLHNSEKSLQGYTFFSPFSSTNAYLVDNCGHLINQWNRGTRPGLAAYFLENGLMLRTYKPNPIGPFTSASNAGRFGIS